MKTKRFLLKFLLLFIYISYGISSSTKAELKLFKAINKDDVKTLSKLFEKKEFSPNYEDSKGKTLLMYAAERNSYEVIDFLLFSGADINFKSSYKTVLDYAIENNSCSLETINYLLNKQAKSFYDTGDGSLALVKLCWKRICSAEEKIKIFELLKSYKLCNLSPLTMYYAGASGDLEFIQYFLDKGLSFDSIMSDYGATCLMRLCSNGYNYLEFYETMYQKDLDDENFEKIAFNIIQYSRNSIPSLNTNDLIYIIKNSKNINYQDSDGATALHYYIYGCFEHYHDDVKDEVYSKPRKSVSLDVIKEFVENGANLNIKDNYYKANPLTLLMYFILESKIDFQPYKDVIKYLIEQGSNVNDEDVYQTSAWLYSACSKNLDIVKLFAESKSCNVNEISIRENDMTFNALYNCLLYYDREVFKYLLSKQIAKESPLEISLLAFAATIHNIEAFDFLIEYDADVNALDNLKTPCLDSIIATKDIDFITKIVNHPSFNPNVVYMWKGEKYTLLTRCIEVFFEKHRNPDLKQIEVMNTIIEKMNKNTIDAVFTTKNGDKLTTLYYFMILGHAGLTESMLKKGANPNFTINSGGVTYLMVAANRCNYEIVKLLIDYGADINKSNKAGLKAIDYSNGRSDILHLLIK